MLNSVVLHYCREQDLKLAVLLYFGGQYSRALDILNQGQLKGQDTESFQKRIKFILRS